MWGSSEPAEVTCIACDETVPRSAAREYDKHGDRFDRADKEFEHLCKACYREICHQPRGDLEATLETAGAGETDRDSFLSRYRELVESPPESE